MAMALSVSWILHHSFSPHRFKHFNTCNLALQPHIKLPYGKLETGNIASVIDFVQPNIVTVRPTESFVFSRKVFGHEASGGTIEYSENTIVFTTLPPVDSELHWMMNLTIGQSVSWLGTSGVKSSAPRDFRAP